MLRVSALLTAAVAVLVLACSDSNRPAATVPEGGPICPASASKAQGASCNSDGYSCSVGYLCGAVWQQAACTCNAAKWACKDATGEDIAGEPKCADVPASTEKCGATLAEMSGKRCNVTGYACYFEGATCAGENNDKPYINVCLCAPLNTGALGDGGIPPRGLYWNCEVRNCNSR